MISFLMGALGKYYARKMASLTFSDRQRARRSFSSAGEEKSLDTNYPFF